MPRGYAGRNRVFNRFETTIRKGKNRFRCWKNPVSDQEESKVNEQLTTAQVWEALEKELFAVIGMVTARGEARTAGVVYVVHERKLYVSTGRASWKARHIAQNPSVSITVPIAKRIPFLPWIKIPAATITFAGTATVHDLDGLPAGVWHKLYRGAETDLDTRADTCVIEVVPEKDFVTYGVGVSLMTMRRPEKARGRAPAA